MGLGDLIGKKVTLYCLNYIYAGDLVGMDHQCVTLKNASIVYETGSHTDTQWKDCQPFPQDWHVSISAIESFGVFK